MVVLPLHAHCQRPSIAGHFFFSLVLKVIKKRVHRTTQANKRRRPFPCDSPSHSTVLLEIIKLEFGQY